MAHFDTTLNIINSAGKELGIIDSDLSDPWAETNQNIVQLRSLLTRAGRNLVAARDWSQLLRAASGSLDGSLRYTALPPDCARIVKDSFWNVDIPQQWPGPIGAADFATYRNSTLFSGTLPPFRQEGNALYFTLEPPACNYDYSYITRYFVGVDALNGTTADTATGPTQYVYFDEPLIVAALKLAWLRAKQMDTTYAQQEYDECFASAAGGDAVAPTIRIAGPVGPGLIDERNLPDTGYGG